MNQENIFIGPNQGWIISTASLVANNNTSCQDQADELVKKADVNGDGSIDYSEFIQLYNTIT